VTNGNQNNVDHLTPSVDKAAAASTIETVSIEEKVQTSRVIHTIPLVVSKRNYASKECGAKVIGANDEAEKYGAILNDKEKDEYMRNACEKAKEKYVIIELCETIQPKSIELANFELFSSSPKNFRILASERQPPMEWTTLGEFEAQDNRNVQTFEIPEHSVYTKFLRLELLTHYGREHYCTLSSFRVYGVSMVDEYEAEATAAFDVVENAGAPFKVTPSETRSTDTTLPGEEALIIPPYSPEVTEPPIEATLETPPVVESIPQIMLPLAPWQIRDCQKCDSKHPKAVTAWLCYVFSPSICSERKTKASRNITSILSKGQIKFLRTVLQPPLICPSHNVSAERKTELKPTIMPPMKQEPVVIQHTVETDVKKQTVVQNKQTLNVPLPAGTTSHKESVFLKLNKRLSLLEMNISLSSQYLTELSRQYVAQTEENKKNYEKTSKYIEEAISRTSLTLSKQFGDQIFEVKKELKDLLAHFHAHPSYSNVIPGRFEKGHESGSLIIRYPAKEHCRTTDYENIYLDESDGLWTTQQLVVVIAVMQATTFGMIFVLQYLWKSSAQASQKVVLISSDIDVKKVIAAEVQNELKQQYQQMQQHLMMAHTSATGLPNTCSSFEHPTGSTPSPSMATSSSPSKKKKKKKRNANSVNTFAIPTSEKWDSTSVSSNISAPSSSICSSTLTSISLKKKSSTASRDSCFTSESTENNPHELHSCFPIS
jgi:hypothetical protein